MAIAKNDALAELVEWMGETDTNQTELAGFLDVSQSMVSRYLAGKTSLPLDKALKLALITGVPVEKLLTGPDASRLTKLLGKHANLTTQKSHG